MASLNGPFFGFPSGKMGGFIFKVRNNKVYISSAPEKSNKPPTAKVLENRNRMGFTSQFCTALIKDTFIKTLWDDSDIKAETARKKAIKTNVSLLPYNDNISEGRIIPLDKLFEVSVQSHEWTNEHLKFILAPLNLKYHPMYYPEMSLHGVIHLFNPLKKKIRKNEFLPVSSESTGFSNNTPLEFRINFTNDDLDFMKKYSSMAVMVTAILLDKRRLPKTCSESIYYEK